MKKITLLFLVLFGLFLSNQAYSQCTTFSGGGPYTNFNTNFGGAPCDDGTGCPFNEISTFEAWADESYLMDNVVIGHTYTFSLCNGPGAGSWTPSFTIIAPSGAVDAFGLDAGSTCALTWTATEEGTYIIGISEGGIPCDTSSNRTTNNGFPAITCTDGDTCVVCTETAAPSCVTEVMPLNNATSVATVENNDMGNITREVAFEWNAAAGADSYEITLDGNVLGQTPNTTVNIFGLDYDTTYTWSVAPVNCFGTAVGCTTWTFTTESALSVSDNELVSFSIYPNPTKDMINFNTTLSIDDVEIYDISGKQVNRIKGENITNDSIDLSQLKVGVYFLKINSDGNIQTIKLIKE